MLKPLDPKPEDVNEWPDFTLNDVKIFYEGKGRYASLLEASSHCSLTVVGILSPLDDDQAQLALTEDYASDPIQIEAVSRYSFGQDDLGNPIVWAAGKAGWYEIRSSKKYYDNYATTIEAIDIFYFLVDQRNIGRQQNKGCTLSTFKREYQKHTNFEIEDEDDVEELLYKHHAFLLKQMYRNAEGLEWKGTHIWKLLAKRHPDIVEEMEEADMNGVDDDTDMEDIEESEEDEEDNNESVRVVWQYLVEIRDGGTAAIRFLNTERIIKARLLDIYDTVEDAAEALRHDAPRLVELMREDETIDWTKRKVFAQLENFAQSQEDIDQDIATPQGKAPKEHHQKSGLRLSRPGGKSRKSTKTALQSQSDSEEDSEDSPRPPELDQLTTPISPIDSGPARQLNGELRALQVPFEERQHMLDLIGEMRVFRGQRFEVGNLLQHITGPDAG